MLAAQFAAFEDFRTKEIRYRELPVVHCAVCATMGAGKSTFINALLGRDVLPSRNEATTAKVTSVYDKDGSDEVVGFCQIKNDITGVHRGVSLKQLDMWNSDASVKRIFLRGDFDGIGNKGMIVAIHDTPGTNNSADASHHRITLDFLASHPLDLLIFVLDAELSGTIDESKLLKDVLLIVRRLQVPVLFVLNKADSIDPERESLVVMINKYRSALERIGFPNQDIFPVSARAARLVKMTLGGYKENLTETESDDLLCLIRRLARHPLSGSISETDLCHTGLEAIEAKIEEILHMKGKQ